MVSQKVTIINPTGLHLRPAGIFCNTAVQYESKVTFQYGNTTANAKSVLSVLGACIKKGCDGADEEAALKAMVKAIEDGLGE